MICTFQLLNESHFLLLLRWLESPHVKKWWDQDVNYTIDLIKAKYSSYIKGYKLIKGIKRPIESFIIYSETNPLGYIQFYNFYDFPRIKALSGLPKQLGAFDIFIGERDFLHQGLGSKVILDFLKWHKNHYSHVFAAPNVKNVPAIKCYEKAGFKKLLEEKDTVEL